MSLYSVTPRVKGRWHAPSGQRPVIPRDKNQFFIVYRLDDLIVFDGFLLGRMGAWSEGGEGWAIICFTCDRVIVVLSSAALNFASLACSLSDKNS